MRITRTAARLLVPLMHWMSRYFMLAVPAILLLQFVIPWLILHPLAAQHYTSWAYHMHDPVDPHAPRAAAILATVCPFVAALVLTLARRMSGRSAVPVLIVLLAAPLQMVIQHAMLLCKAEWLPYRFRFTHDDVMWLSRLPWIYFAFPLAAAAIGFVIGQWLSGYLVRRWVVAPASPSRLTQWLGRHIGQRLQQRPAIMTLLLIAAMPAMLSVNLLVQSQRLRLLPWSLLEDEFLRTYALIMVYTTLAAAVVFGFALRRARLKLWPAVLALLPLPMLLLWFGVLQDQWYWQVSRPYSGSGGFFLGKMDIKIDFEIEPMVLFRAYAIGWGISVCLMLIGMALGTGAAIVAERGEARQQKLRSAGRCGAGGAERPQLLMPLFRWIGRHWILLAILILLMHLVVPWVATKMVATEKRIVNWHLYDGADPNTALTVAAMAVACPLVAAFLLTLARRLSGRAVWPVTVLLLFAPVQLIMQRVILDKRVEKLPMEYLFSAPGTWWLTELQPRDYLVLPLCAVAAGTVGGLLLAMLLGRWLRRDTPPPAADAPPATIEAPPAVG